MARFLVISSPGFINAHAAEVVIGRGYAVTGVANINGTCDVLHRPPSHQTKTLANRAEISKAKLLPGREPQMSLVYGMRHFTGWYCSERPWVEEVVTP
jgi:hypothetical protein